MKTLNAFDVSLCRLWRTGLAARFASCPPRFALLLDLRKTHNQPALFEMVSYALRKTSFLVPGMVCLLPRSQGGGQRPGDMSGSRYAVAVEGSAVHKVISSQLAVGIYGGSQPNIARCCLI